MDGWTHDLNALLFEQEKFACLNEVITEKPLQFGLVPHTKLHYNLEYSKGLILITFMLLFGSCQSLLLKKNKKTYEQFMRIAHIYS